jgi:hypothetical protein
LHSVKTCHCNAAAAEASDKEVLTSSDETLHESDSQPIVRVRLHSRRLRSRLPSGSRTEIWYPNPPRRSSFYEWKYPLDALANAWDRLLAFVGWRR